MWMQPLLITTILEVTSRECGSQCRKRVKVWWSKFGAVGMGTQSLLSISTNVIICEIFYMAIGILHFSCIEIDTLMTSLPWIHWVASGCTNNSLHHKAWNFRNVFFSNSFYVTTNVSIPLMTMSENYARCLVPNAIFLAIKLSRVKKDDEILFCNIPFTHVENFYLDFSSEINFYLHACSSFIRQNLNIFFLPYFIKSCIIVLYILYT